MKDQDFFETPAWVTRAILPHVPLSSSVLDPCAGKGAILKVVSERIDVECCDGMEIDPALSKLANRYGGVETCDALKKSWHAGLVLMNPPFSKALAFVIHGINETAPHGASCAALLRLGMAAGQKRAKFWSQNPADVFVLPRRPSFTGGGTDRTEYAWFVWGPGRGGRWSVVPMEACK